MDNHRLIWSEKDIEIMHEFRAKGMSSREIGCLLGRSPAAIDCCLSRERQKAAARVNQPAETTRSRPGFFERIFGRMPWWK